MSPYVWITETSGMKRFVDDQWLNPCYKCGEKISACQANALCNEVKGNFFCVLCNDEGCGTCGQNEPVRCDHGAMCCCDDVRDAEGGVK